VNRLYLLREHRLHGIVTGLGLVKTLATKDDGLDRLLISFKDVKVSGRLLESTILELEYIDLSTGVVGLSVRHHHPLYSYIRTHTTCANERLPHMALDTPN
jgi:hypothetical protein